MRTTTDARSPPFKGPRSRNGGRSSRLPASKRSEPRLPVRFKLCHLRPPFFDSEPWSEIARIAVGLAALQELFGVMPGPDSCTAAFVVARRIVTFAGYRQLLSVTPPDSILDPL